MAKFNEKIDFVDHISSKGARYIGYESFSLDHALATNPYDDAYILFFNDYIRYHCDRWNENLNLLLEILQDGGENTDPDVVTDGPALYRTISKRYKIVHRNMYNLDENGVLFGVLIHAFSSLRKTNRRFALALERQTHSPALV
jgi:hypothetical protein